MTIKPDKPVNCKHTSRAGRLAAIMPARRSFYEGKPTYHSQDLSSAGSFTDIVGYTALMGSDEDLAFQVL